MWSSRNKRYSMEPYNQRFRDSQKKPVKRLKQSQPGRILRIQVLNSQCRVTTDGFHYIFSQYGHVLRIVIFNTAYTQNAMIEFDSIEGASQARHYLNNFDLYLGCNTLKIEFAWTTKLNVLMNDVNKCWDYTRPVYKPSQTGCYDSGSMYQTSYNANYQNTMHQHEPYRYENNEMQMTIPITTTTMNYTERSTMLISTTPLCQANVIMVSGLTYDSSNTDNVFNLTSLYGNVWKIQICQNHQGPAFIVQMYDQISAENCIQYLNNIPIGNHGKLQVEWISQEFQPKGDRFFMLNDGTPSYKDYNDSKNQRFLIPRPAYWIQPPSKTVRFYNTPANFTKQNICDIFKYENVIPVAVTFLHSNEDNTSTSRGILEFSSVAQAVLAVMKCNNKVIRSPIKGINYMKLCFSSSQPIELKN